MNQDNRNLVLAIVCSALLVIAYQIFFELPKQQRLAEQNQKLSEELSIVTPEKIEDKKLETIDDNKVNISAPRINIDNPSLTGSITLAGARIDDIILKNYTVTNDPLSDKITLLNKKMTLFEETMLPFCSSQKVINIPQTVPSNPKKGANVIVVDKTKRLLSIFSLSLTTSA
mgnify:CR=1 FL=1